MTRTGEPRLYHPHATRAQASPKRRCIFPDRDQCVSLPTDITSSDVPAAGAVSFPKSVLILQLGEGVPAAGAVFLPMPGEPFSGRFTATGGIFPARHLSGRDRSRCAAFTESFPAAGAAFSTAVTILRKSANHQRSRSWEYSQRPARHMFFSKHGESLSGSFPAAGAVSFPARHFSRAGAQQSLRCFLTIGAAFSTARAIL